VSDRRRLRRLAIAVGVALAAFGCVGCVGSGAGASRPVEVTVFGAASLTDALEEVRSAYHASHPGLTLTMSYGASSALRAQIEQGAPADLFLSADIANPQALFDRGLTDGGPVPFVDNALTIVVPADNPAAIRTPADLARRGVKVVAAGSEVPITRYATKAIEVLARLPGYPPSFVDAYEANIVSRELDVRAVVTRVELGEADAGIVYVTDARASDRLATVDIPDEANVPATYSGVVIGGSRERAAARALLDWLTGPGRQILVDHGFRPPFS
jgi:molybdate transport system substrate-binding protein